MRIFALLMWIYALPMWIFALPMWIYALPMCMQRSVPKLKQPITLSSWAQRRICLHLLYAFRFFAKLRMTVLSNVLTHSHFQKTLSFKKKVGIFVLKFGIFVLKVGVFFKDLAIFFSKLGIFSGKGRLHHPSLSRLFPFHHSSLHFNQNALTINRLRMTGHPLILLSLTLFKSFQICLQHLHR